MRSHSGSRGRSPLRASGPRQRRSRVACGGRTREHVLLRVRRYTRLGRVVAEGLKHARERDPIDDAVPGSARRSRRRRRSHRRGARSTAACRDRVEWTAASPRTPRARPGRQGRATCGDARVGAGRSRGSFSHRGMPMGTRGSAARWLKRGKRSMSRSRRSSSTACQSGGRANHRTLVMIARFVGRSMRSQAASMALMSLTSTHLAATERGRAGGRTRIRSRRPSHALPPNRETLYRSRRGSPSPRPARSSTRAR